jgi:hypothetical protein
MLIINTSWPQDLLTLIWKELKFFFLALVLLKIVYDLSYEPVNWNVQFTINIEYYIFFSHP